MTDELRDADGCEDCMEDCDCDSHCDCDCDCECDCDADNEEQPFAETDDGEPEIVMENPAEKALQEQKDKYMRLFAEFDNFRKRTAKEKSETYQDAVAKTVLELLPVVDSLERALAVPCADEAYHSGVEKIYSQLAETLKKLGVTEIPAQGEVFDPKVHNAIRQVEDEQFSENTVCEVYQKGYLLGSRIVRHAMVSVANCG